MSDSTMQFSEDDYTLDEVEVDVPAACRDDPDIRTRPIEARDKVPGLDHLAVPQYPSFMTYIYNSVNRGYSPIICICGRERSGKSTTGTWILDALHNRMQLMRGEVSGDTIQDHLTYDTLEFLEMVEDESRQGIIVDEAGTVLNKNNYHSSFNRSVDDTVQTMGFKNNVYILITPKVNDLDPAVRDRINVLLLNNKRGYVDVTGIKNRYDQLGGNNRQFKDLGYWVHDEPDDELTSAYTEKEIGFKMANHRRNIKELRAERAKEEKKSSTSSVDDILGS